MSERKPLADKLRDRANGLRETKIDRGSWKTAGLLSAAAAHIRTLEAQLAESQARERWVPVSERMPKIGQQVLCWVANEGRWYEGGLSENGRWLSEAVDASGWSVVDEPAEYRSITHWREIQPPRKNQ
jgi:hypothetical protein